MNSQCYIQDSQNAVSIEQLQGVQKTIEMVGQQLKQLSTASQHTAPKSRDEAARKKYQFWETQPVPKFGRCIVPFFPCHTDEMNWPLSI